MRALVLGSNATLVLNVVWALGAAGHESDIISDWHLPRARFSRHCRRYTRVPYGSLQVAEPQFTRELAKYCQDHDIDLVIPADLESAQGLARVDDAHIPRFPVAAPDTLELLHDKWRFYQLLRSHQLPTPYTVPLAGDHIEIAAQQLSYPILLKPSRSEGGVGIVRCDSASELCQLWQQAEFHQGHWLAQQFIPGSDVDISVLADHGEVVAHSIQRDESASIKVFMHDERIVRVAREIVRASQFHGLAHFDMRIAEDTGEVYVIECNPRVWGSLMYSVWAGVNFIELGCRLARGQQLPVSIAPHERVWHQGVAPRRMIKALLQGRSAPAGMSGATLASWRQAHGDAWTQLIGNWTEAREFRLRRAVHGG